MTSPTPDPLARQEAAAVGSAYDRLAPTYDAHYDDPVSAAEDRRVTALLRHLLPRRVEDCRVLDVGCGTGWFLRNVGHPRAYRGFDVSEGMLAQARRYAEAHETPHRLVRGDLNDAAMWRYLIDHTGGIYDAVVSTFASPSYATDPALLARRCARMLAPGGLLFLMPHAFGNLQRRPYLADDPDAYLGDEPWSEAMARDALREAGLTPLRVTGLRHPVAGPTEARTSPRLHDAWLRYEAWRYRPDELSFLVIAARKDRS